MAKRARGDADYENAYANYRFELSPEGILLMQCHTNGGSLVWDWKAHDEMSDAFADVAGDREIRCLIHTGTGDNYNANWLPEDVGVTLTEPGYQAMPGDRGTMKLDEKQWYSDQPHREHPGGGGADDQRRQRTLQHPLRGAVDGRHRARL